MAVSEKQKQQCKGKVSYKTERVAHIASSKKGALHNKALRAYHCPCCKFWHLTSKTWWSDDKVWRKQG